VVGLNEGGLPLDVAALRSRFDATYDQLAATRPTAVNLVWALDIGRGVFEDSIAADCTPTGVRDRLLEWAKKLHADDIQINILMGDHGARLFEAGDRVMTHCNAGALATGGYGTAVGVITSAWNEGRLGSVWVDETRPLLQGARLTSWELKKLGIPFHLVTDNSAGSLMSRGMVDRVVVGADRIAANGDAANKIGTYMVAAVAHRHGVPFYVAAPLSTIDRNTPTGADIPIEERNPNEVTHVFDVEVAPDGIEALNIAFDVTPNELIAAIITEEGVLLPPFAESISAAFEARQARIEASE
jgi:methylthioribose-1-phosphate isomerase